MLACGILFPSQSFADNRKDDSISHQNIRYGEKCSELTADDPDSDRLLDLFLPKEDRPAEGYPVVMFIHGGGFRSGSKNANSSLFQEFLNRGYAVVTINYYLNRKFNEKERSPGKRPMPERNRNRKSEPVERMNIKSGSYSALIDQSVKIASDDALLALNWLAEHGQEYHLNTDQVVLMGGSAGAMTALRLVYTLRPTVLKVKGVVDLWGSLNNAEDIKAGDPPVCIIHGDQDKTVNIGYAYALKDRLEEVNVKYEFHVLEGLGHAQYRYVSKNMMGELCTFIQKCLDSTK